MHRDEIHIRDPFVFVEDDRYYLLGTTGDDPWGLASDFTLYESSDLETFDPICIMVEDSSLAGYTNRWAPELHRYEGKYYLIVSLFRADKGRGSMVLVSSSLGEPFVPLTGEYITPEGWGCLDATLFIHEGKPYLCFSNEWTTPITHDGDGALFIAELSHDLRQLVTPPVKIISGKYNGLSKQVCNSEARGFVAEGPWLYEDGNRIVLLWSTFTETGYTVIQSHSEGGVYGDYVFDRVVFSKDGGHCMRFLDLQGKPWITMHQPNQTPLERMRLFPAD